MRNRRPFHQTPKSARTTRWNRNVQSKKKIWNRHGPKHRKCDRSDPLIAFAQTMYKSHNRSRQK
jgi:hypothetical protein